MSELSEEEKKAIEMLKQLKFKDGNSFCQVCVYPDRKKCYSKTTDCQGKTIKTILNLIENQQAELEKKEKIINNAINAVENLRQYFDESTQADFIGILEILKDKKVIDW